MQVNPLTNHIVMIEKDYNCYTASQQNALKQQVFDQTSSQEYFDLDFGKVGYPKPGAGALEAAGFASCVRIVDPYNFETVYLQEFEDKETVFSLYISKNVGLPG